MGSQQFCLKWNNHQSNMLTVFEQLLSNEAFVDVTLACEGLSLKAHKMVLSACSPFFQALFVENPCKHPIVILKDTRYMDLKAIVEFMYRGEVNVSQDQLSALLKTAETLKVKGLAEVTGERSHNLVPVNGEGTRPSSPPLAKRKRGRPRRRSASDSNRSDSEDQSARVKGAPDSPEIIEDGSLSCDRLSLPTPAKVAARTSTTTAAAVVPVTTSAKDSSVHEDTMPVDDAAGSPADDVDFEVDASNLMEQSMTTENARVFPDVQSSTLVLAEASTHHTASSQESTQLATSLPSDISISSQDIKPAPSSLIPYNDPSASSSAVVPTQPPSAVEAASGGSLLFMDSSGVPAIPGPSNYNADKQPSTPSHGPQKTSRRAHMVFLKKSETASQEAPKVGKPAEPATKVTAAASSSTQIIPVSSKTTAEGQRAVRLSAEQIATIRRLAAGRQGQLIVIPIKHKVDVPIQQVIAKAIQQETRATGIAAATGVAAATESETVALPHADAGTATNLQGAIERNLPVAPILEKAMAELQCPTPDPTPAFEVVVPPSRSPQKTIAFASAGKKPMPLRGKRAGALRAKKRAIVKTEKTSTRIAKKSPAKPGVQMRKLVLTDPVEGQNVITLPLHDASDEAVHQVVVETHPRGSNQEAPKSITYTLQKGNKTVYLCSSCPYTTARKAHLIEHERTHTGERPYKCRYCEYASSRNCHLKDHERTHSVEKPFKCCLCDYSAKRKHHLQDHIKTHVKKRKKESSEETEEALDCVDTGFEESFQF